MKSNEQINKIKAVVLYILQSFKDGTDYIKLFKLMYFAQRGYLAKYGRPIFEDSFLSLYLGTTPATAISHGQFQYVIIVIILAFVTYYSFKMNSTTSQNNQTAMMTRTMTIMIIVMSIFMTTALDIYWLTSSIFTIGQNLLIKRSNKI